MQSTGLDNRASEMSLETDPLFPPRKGRSSQQISSSPLLHHTMYLVYRRHRPLTSIQGFQDATCLMILSH